MTNNRGVADVETSQVQEAARPGEGLRESAELGQAEGTELKMGRGLIWHTARSAVLTI